LYFSEKKGTIKQELKDFAVKDTSAITKIFLTNKSNQSVTLERMSPGQWKVNGKYNVRKDLIDVLLKTMGTLEVQSTVAKAARNNVIKRLSTGAVKTEIYEGEDTPSKIYYVGGATKNGKGTYMLIENSSEPFIMHIPYFYGYLSTRYNTSEDEWKDKMVLNYEFKDIAFVEVRYPQNLKNSYSITNIGDWAYELRCLANDSVIENYDTTAVTIYLTNFTKLNYEGFTKTIPQEAKDSILASEPVNILECRGANGNKTTIKTFLKPTDTEQRDFEGNLIPFDPDRMYAEINTDRDLVTIQFFVFDKVFLGLNNFLKNEN